MMIGRTLSSSDNRNKSKPSIESAFRQHIGNIKFCLKNLNSAEERRIVLNWINKLCECALPSNPETERKNCNLYAQILLKMLQRGHIRKPFASKPTPGKLPTVPVYMSTYLEESHDQFEPKDHTEPKWLNEKSLDDSTFLHSFNYDTKGDQDNVNDRHHDNQWEMEDSFRGNQEDLELAELTLGGNKSYLYGQTKSGEGKDVFQMDEADELEMYLKTQEKSFADLKKDIRETAQVRPSHTFKNHYSVDNNMNFQEHTRDKNKPPSPRHNPVHWKHNSSKEKALEKKLELLEKKIEVESTKIQQQQSTMVRNILDRKNSEISDIKLFYQKKIAEMDAMIQSRDGAIKTLTEKLDSVEQEHMKEVEVLKTTVHDKDVEVKKAKDDFEELHGKMTELETNTKNLKRSHFKKVEELVAEGEKNVVDIRQELEKENSSLREKISKLTDQLMQSDHTKESLSLANANLNKKEEYHTKEIERQNLELTEMKARLDEGQKENLRLMEESRKALNSVQQKAEKTLNNMKNDALKANTRITELEMKITNQTEDLHKLETNKKSELKELSIAHKEKLVELESMLNKKIQKLHSNLDTKEGEHNTLLEKYATHMKTKENEISSLRERLLKQSKESEKAIELLRSQAEEQSTSMFNELNGNLSQLQKALTESRDHTEQQRLHFLQEIEEQKNKHEAKFSSFRQHMEGLNENLQERFELAVTEHAEHLAKQRMEYEENVHGLLPHSVKVELEDTIESLRQQISLLQSQVELLREEVDVSASFNKSSRTRKADDVPKV